MENRKVLTTDEGEVRELSKRILIGPVRTLLRSARRCEESPRGD